MRTILVFAAGCLLAVPLSVVITVLLFPVWSRLESSFGIESVGHSGPADWCYGLIFAMLFASMLSLLVLGARTRRKDRLR
ncbi:MAG: hypothetical protein HOP03_15215 [Lysobacter sp.]|nr:hypothetical protein [Lysobacter sp.]